VPKLQPIDLKSQGLPNYLMAQADSQHRNESKKPVDSFDYIREAPRVARSVRNYKRVGRHGEDLGGRGASGKNSHTTVEVGEAVEDTLLHSTIEDGDVASAAHSILIRALAADMLDQVLPYHPWILGCLAS